MQDSIIYNFLLKYGKIKLKPKKKLSKKNRTKPIVVSDITVNPLRLNYKNDMLTRAVKTRIQIDFDEVFNTVGIYLGKHKITLNDFTYLNNSFYNEFNSISHNERVLMYISYIAINEKIDNNGFNLLVIASKLHDIGRNSYTPDPLHGHKGAEIIKKHNLVALDDYNLKILLTMIDAHSAYDKNLEGILHKYDIELKDYEYVKKLAYILKDAEALDKVRFLNEDKINPEKLVKINLLKTNTAKQLIKFAVELNDEYKKPGFKFSL